MLVINGGWSSRWSMAMVIHMVGGWPCVEDELIMAHIGHQGCLQHGKCPKRDGTSQDVGMLPAKTFRRLMYSIWPTNSGHATLRKNGDMRPPTCLIIRPPRIGRRPAKIGDETNEEP